jgi:S-phase kinase-associated protein 1
MSSSNLLTFILTNEKEVKLEETLFRNCKYIISQVNQSITKFTLQNADDETIERLKNFLENYNENYLKFSENKTKDSKLLNKSYVGEWSKALNLSLCEDKNGVFNLLMTAYELEIKDLLDLCCNIVSNAIIGKSPAEIRETFDIKNDFTPEEEELVIKENSWIDESCDWANDNNYSVDKNDTSIFLNDIF